MAKPVLATNDVPPATTWNEWFVNVNFSRKTTFEDVTSSTVLQNDDELFVSVAANAVYRMETLLHYDGDAGGDLKIQYTTPASASMSFWASGLTATATLYSDDQNAAFDLSSASVAFGAIGVGTTCTVRLSGLLITAGTAGTTRLQWAQRTAFATRTRVFAGSYMDFRRVE